VDVRECGERAGRVAFARGALMSTATTLRQHGLPAALSLLVVGLLVLTLCLGSVNLPPGEMLRYLLMEPTAPLGFVVREIRLPRALLALAVGASLGISGAALQAWLRNPLAEPGIVGVSGGAALGAVLVFYSGLAGSAWWVLPSGGLLGAWLAVTLVLGIAGRTSDVETVILAGVAINAFCAAMTSLVLNLVPNPFAAYEIYFWLLGSLADRDFDHLRFGLPFMLLGAMLLFKTRTALDALALGEDTAASLGIDIARTRRLLLAGCALAVGASVALCGAIGFVGLIVPHLMRRVAGHRMHDLFIPCALAGAALTLAADLGTRLPAGKELQLGVVTALLGTPLFLHLVLRRRHPL
jgi:iron complex transport system permease protein